MNLAFYGLAEHPFKPTPDPRFLNLTAGQREALAQLAYGVQERKAFILLTGEAGTGKTTLVQALLERLDGKTAVAVVTNSMLPFEGLLEYALEELGIAKPGGTHAQRLFALQTFLIDRFRAGQNTLLVLDEAQSFSVETLEQIRMLSNFETPSEKILQILLVGQPELRTRLERTELRQFMQRIGLRCNISPLTDGEVRNYIRGRLRTAGARNLTLFTDAATVRIARHSGGIPRLINVLCDHCLLIGYADQVRGIDRATVDEAIAYLEAGARPQRLRRTAGRREQTRSRRWGVLAASVALALLAGGVVLSPVPLGHVLDQSASWLSAMARSVRALTPP